MTSGAVWKLALCSVLVAAFACVADATDGGAFDAAAATEAYLAKMTPEAVAKSDAYFEGGYWLILWNYLAGAAVSLLLLTTGLSGRMQRLAQRVIGWRWLQPLAYGAPYLVIATLLTMPLTLYEGYFREHAYGLSNQTLGQWLAEFGISLGVGAALGGVALVGLYAILRRVGRSWWIWATVGAAGFILMVALIAPVFIAPLFNKYRGMEAGPLRDRILSMARANQIPADEVYTFDASTQSKRISANVSGALGTMRISLNDNLLKRCSPEAVEAVMGHEMGHYVMNHVYVGVTLRCLVVGGGLAFAAWGFERIVRRKGAAWGIGSVSDPAGLPLISLLVSTWFFVMTPVTNSITRMEENEADAFGLNAARQPDGFAEAALMLSEYRKMRPSKWEEVVFFDHPSGYARIARAMRWKAELEPAGARSPGQ